jgi:hypothetical protein
MRLITVTVSTAIVAMSGPAFAATHCVRMGGGSGCAGTISAAVAAAAPGDTVFVEHGTYPEEVVITKPILLIGDGRENTIIDATGRGNGINVDGFDHPGLSHVTVSGLTVEHAMSEGIFVSNASNVSITGTRVVDNDRGLVNGQCALLVPPDTPMGEGFDCGEAIHLSAVDHSLVESNIVERNSGGILISDDSGPTHDNLVSGNLVADNAYDCGITLASHKPFAPNGVYRNTIADNSSLRNGLAGEGAGVGLFTPAPGTATYSNVVVGNTLVGNGMPGVAMHSHAPGQNLNDNAIVGNYIAANGADRDDAATAGPTGINVFGVTPITGTIISRNVIEREAIGIAVKTASEVDVHLNDLQNHQVGVANLGSGTVDATENWWGCGAGPASPGCAAVTGSVAVTPWLRTPVAARAKGGQE